VSVDGGAWSDVDLYSASTVYRASVYRKTGLDGGTHTLRLEWTGRQNGASTSSQIDIDAIDIAGTPGALVQAP
jgi:hypothetical protein